PTHPQTSPNPSADPSAMSSTRLDRPGFPAGLPGCPGAGRVRETRTTPATAARTPRPARAPGWSPVSTAAATGTTAPQAEMGATTDMVPSARLRENRTRGTALPGPA